MYAKEVTGGQWYGVSIPAWLRVFDCRMQADQDIPLTPWGATLFAGEKASVDLGLRGITPEGERFYHDTTPCSCSTYIDSRTCSESELVRQVTDMVAEATKLYTEYQAALQSPAKEGEGGSCLYLPVAVEMSNYGWGVISDRRTQVVRAFKAW